MSAAVDRLLTDRLQLIIAASVIAFSLAVIAVAETRAWLARIRDERRSRTAARTATPDEVAAWLPAIPVASAAGKERAVA